MGVPDRGAINAKGFSGENGFGRKVEDNLHLQ